MLPQHNTVSQPEDVGSMVIRNVGILPRHYTASQPKRPQLGISPPWKPQIPISLCLGSDMMETVSSLSTLCIPMMTVLQYSQRDGPCDGDIYTQKTSPRLRCNIKTRHEWATHVQGLQNKGIHWNIWWRQYGCRFSHIKVWARGLVWLLDKLWGTGTSRWNQ